MRDTTERQRVAEILEEFDPIDFDETGSQYATSKAQALRRRPRQPGHGQKPHPVLGHILGRASSRRKPGSANAI